MQIIKKKEWANRAEIDRLLDDLNKCEKNDAWSCIVSNKSLRKTATWEELMGFLLYVERKNKSILNKSIESLFGNKSEKQIDIFESLESLGLDYNHIDYLGQNFAHYLVRCIQRNANAPLFEMRAYSNIPSFCKFIVEFENVKIPKNALEYILDKTTDVGLKNLGGENVLSNYMSKFSVMDDSAALLEFKGLIKKYPELDIHCIDKGNNLLSKAITLECMSIANYLIEQNVECVDIKDRLGKDILSAFIDSNLNNESVVLFKKIMEKNNFALTKDGQMKEYDCMNILDYMYLRCSEIPNMFANFVEKEKVLNGYAAWLDIFIDEFKNSIFFKDGRTMSVFKFGISKLKDVELFMGEYDMAEFKNVLIKADKIILEHDIDVDLISKDKKTILKKKI